MKIIHTADLHLDSVLETNLNSQIQRDRKRELLSNFERLVEYANKHNVDRIIIAGDLFDSNRISQKSKNFIVDIINSNPNIDFLYVTGNHEEDAFLNNINTIPENLKTFTKKFETYTYSDCDITGINYTDKYDFTDLNLKEDRVNILIIHGDINTNLHTSFLKDRNIDYVALGHIHKYLRGNIDDRTEYCYPGCLEGRGFDECGEKGFSLLEVIGNKVKSEFVPFAQRVLHEVIVDISDCENYIDVKRLVLLKYEDIKEKDMIKVRLVGKYNLDIFKQNEMLSDSLNEKYYFARIVDDSTLKINPRDYENDISLNGEFIRNVLKSNLSDEDKNQVIEFGIKALMKEDLE